MNPLKCFPPYDGKFDPPTARCPIPARDDAVSIKVQSALHNLQKPAAYVVDPFPAFLLLLMLHNSCEAAPLGKANILILHQVCKVSAVVQAM